METEENRQFELLRLLSTREEFKEWVKLVVEPTIKQIEADLYEKMESLSEVELRARLKHINSIKYMFEDIFAIVRQRLSEEK